MNLNKCLRHLKIMCERTIQKIKLLDTKIKEFKQEENLLRLLNKKKKKFLSQVEPKHFVEASKDEGFMKAMEEVLNQKEKNQTQELVAT